MIKLNQFDFLWKMSTEHLNVEESLLKKDKYSLLKDKIRHILELKNNLQQLPKEITIDCLVISTNIFREVLLSLLNDWQNKYGQHLHEEAKRLLNEATFYREGVTEELQQDVHELEQLNELLLLLDQIFDLDLKIDSVYQPIEMIYSDLKDFELPILRSEQNDLDNLRHYWNTLITMAESQRNRLLNEKRNVFHQELDKQMKKFIVEVIQFRNLFDFECPSMAGSDPIEVEKKLEKFQQHYLTYEEKRNTLVAISKLFGLKIQSFHELESMKEDLLLLTQLYSLYQRFSTFEKVFQNSLWNVVDLDDVYVKFSEFWDECLALPSKLKEKESYIELKGKIDYCIKIHSILSDLSSKEIRNRHWIQVMQVTGTNFQLEAGTFKCSDLINLPLLEFKKEINRICYQARKEMELELKLSQIEEEWTEQVLVFQTHPRKGQVELEVNFTNSLLQQLEDSQIIVMNMFKSGYIEPMKEEAAQWASKLMEISDVLGLWLDVQQLWINLEFVFSNPTTIKDLSQEYKRFERLDKSYIKSMQRVYETKNVFQCCISNEYSKKSFLKNIQQGLESCFESLKGYLQMKRDIFPRLWFVPDETILSLVNCAEDHKNLGNHFSSIFTAVDDLHIESGMDLTELQIDKVFGRSMEELILCNKIKINDDVVNWLNILSVEMENSLTILSDDSIKYIYSSDNLEELPRKFPSQICNAALHLYWTDDINESMMELKSDKMSLSNSAKKFNSQVSRIPITLNRNSWKSSDDQMTTTERTRLESMTLGALYLRDSLMNLLNKKIKDNDDFEWSKLIKMKTEKSGNIGMQRYQLAVLSSSYELGQEFQGSKSTIAWTPMTEKYLLCIFSNFDHQKISSLCGKANSGKSTLISELTRITNKFHVTKHCQSNMSIESLTNFMYGLATNGCWGIMDNYENLGQTQMRLLMVMIGQIKDAVRQKQLTVTFLDKKEVNLLPNINLFLLSGLSTEPFENLIPGNMREEFRILAIVTPDLFQILKWYCVHFNFRAGKILALRLYAVMKQANSLADNYGQPVVNLRSIISALEKASVCKIPSVVKDKIGLSDIGQTTGSSLLEFWPSFIERKIKSPSSSFIKQKSNETPISLSAAAKVEHNLVLEALIQICLPSILPENEKILKEILKDTFQSYSESHFKSLKETIPIELLNAIRREAKSRKYSVSDNLMEKYIQLYNVAKYNQGVILYGPTFSGKSVSLEILIAALNHVCDNYFLAEKELTDNVKTTNNDLTDLLRLHHHLYSLYPMIYEDESELFGTLSAKQDFHDGLFTHIWRIVNRNNLISWIVFDGIIQSAWSQNLNSILNDGHILHLPDGHQLFQSKTVKFIFEMNCMKEASPGIVSRSGLIYFPGNLINWKDLKSLLLANKRPLEIAALNKIFDLIMNPMQKHISQNYKEESGGALIVAFQNCLKILSQVLVDNKEIGGELHIQRLFVFCLIWSLKSQIMELNKQAITDLLKKETAVLPDDDNSICIFDYYVDESGEWDLWSSLLKNNIDKSSLHLTGEILVDTINTLRCKYFLNIATRASQNIAIIGPKGSGKSLILDNHWRKQDLSKINIVKFIYSYFTKSSQLKSFLEANIEHRQGFMYSGIENKHLTILIEDLNLPNHHHLKSNNLSGPNEILRQLLDSKIIQNSKSPFEQIKLSGFNVIATIATNTNADYSNFVDPRLMRHFIPINIETPERSEINSIVRGIFECHINSVENSQITSEQISKLIKATQKIFENVSSVLHQSSMEGRSHLLFTPRHINEIAIKICSFKKKISDNLLLKLWSFSVKRFFQYCLILDWDLLWFNKNLHEVIQDLWSTEISNDTIVDQIFFSFPTCEDSSNNDQINEHPPSSSVARPLDNFKSERELIISKINQFKEKLGNTSFHVIPSDNLLLQVNNIHRQITKPFNGNAIVIGSVGCHLSLICSLALEIAKIPLYNIDSTTDASLIDSMKNILRLVGSEGQKLAIVLTAKDFHSNFILDILNSLMIIGDYPLLFPPDEMSGLLSTVLTNIKKDKSSAILTNYELLEQFRSRIKRHLHILICLPPENIIINQSLSKYPGILTYASINWIRNSDKTYISTDANYFIQNILKIKEYLRSELFENNLIQYVTGLHSEALKFTIPESTMMDESCRIGKITVNDKRKEIYKYETVPIAPYSQLFLREKLRKLNEDFSQKRIYFTICTFHRFLFILKRLLNKKTIERTQSTQTITRALNSIEQTKYDIITINELILRKREKFTEISSRSQELLQKLIDKITLLKMTFAKRGENNYLNEILLQNSTYQEKESTKDPLLEDTERDELDLEFENIREECLKNRQAVIKDILEKTRKEYMALKKDLTYSMNQVKYWQSKIDRQAIERIKSFQNPPALVVDVIEMIFVLIGKQIQNPRKFSCFEENINDEKSKGHWKRMQQFMADPVKFVEIIRNVSWTDGLNYDVYKSVKEYLGPTNESQTGVTGEGTFLNQAENVKIKPKKSKPVNPEIADNEKVDTSFISVSATKYASEDAALLVQYAVALVEYTEKCEPLRKVLQKIHELEIEIEEIDSSKSIQNESEIGNYNYMALNLSDEEVENLKIECTQLEKDYNELIGNRFTIEMELKALSERVDMNAWLINNIKTMETKWQILLKKYQDEKGIFILCLISAAYLAYGGPMNYEQRQMFLEYCISSSKSMGLASDNLSCSKLEIIHFLHSEIEISKMKSFNLSYCEDEIDNAYFILNDSLFHNWILISDPIRRVLYWLDRYLIHYDPVVVPYSDCHDPLERCLLSGKHIILTDCDVVHLAQNPLMIQIFRNQHLFFTEKKPFKLLLGNGREIECHPNFRIFFHTCALPHEIPNVLIYMTFLVSFNTSTTTLISEYLSRFTEKAKPIMHMEHRKILREKQRIRKQLLKLEEQMLDDLSNGIRNVKSIESCKTIVNYLKMYDEINNNLQQLEFVYLSNKKSIDNYNPIAVRFVTIFQMARKMETVQTDYFVNFEKYLNFFDSMIESFDRLSNKSIIDQVTSKTCKYSLLSMKEENKLVFCLLVSIEIHKTMGHIEAYQDEYLISPISVAQKLHPELIIHSESKSSSSKKPFDWISEENMANIKILSASLPCFKDILENMFKDAKENQWKMLFESDSPETSSFIEKLFKTPIDAYQKLCLIRTLRPDRIIQAIYLFIQNTINIKFKNIIKPSDIRLALMATSPTSATLLKYVHDSKETELILNQIKTDTNMHLVYLRISDYSREGMSHFFNQLQNQISGVNKVFTNTDQTTSKQSLFNSIYLVIHLFSTEQISAIHSRIITYMDNLYLSQSKSTVSKSRNHDNVSFKLFFTLPHNCKEESTGYLNEMTTVYLDYSGKVRDFLTYLFRIGYNSNSMFASDSLPLLHNISLLISILKYRSLNTSVGFYNTQIISKLSNPTNFYESVDKIFDWFDSNSTHSWNMLKHLISEVIFGSRVTSESDRSSINSIIDFWLSPNAVRKEFEFPKLKYRCPSILYSPNAKLPDIKRAFSLISPFLFESAEACHMSSTSLTKLNFDKKLMDKIVEVNRISSATSVIDLSKVENELFEISKNLSRKMPKSTIENICEKLKKVPNNFIFTKILMRELLFYHIVFGEVSAFLQKMRKVITHDMVNIVTDEDIAIILALIKNQIPQSWLNKQLHSNGYNGYSLMEWIGSLLSKYQHLEKLILTNKDKISCYWLGAFQNPESFLSFFKEEISSQFIRGDRSGNYKDIKCFVDFTNKDKDHIREPPSDGIYIYGLHLWGCGFDRGNGELVDVSVKGVCTALPIVHIIFTTSDQEKSDSVDQYLCPIFIDSNLRQEPILHVSISKEGVPSSKWMLRGVFITINPF